MDILALSVEETGTLHLKGPDGARLYDKDGAAMTVTLYSPGSKQYVTAQAANQNRMIEILRATGKPDGTADEKAKEQVEFLVACTKEFSPNFQYGTEALTGSALARAVYSNLRLGYIPEQVAKHLGEWGNFTKASPKP